VAASGTGFAVWAFSEAENAGSADPARVRTKEGPATAGEPWAGKPLPPAEPDVVWREQVGPKGQTPAILHAYGSLWVSFYEGSGGEFLARVDPGTGEILARIDAVSPGWVTGGGGLAAGFDDIWATGGWEPAVVKRIDPDTNEVTATIPLGGTEGADIAVGAGAVWVAFTDDDHSGLARIDPSTNEVVATSTIESDYVRSVEASEHGVVVLEFVWMRHGPCGVLSSIDPEANAITAREPVGDSCSYPRLLEWEGTLWASTFDGFDEIDPGTARLVGEPIRFEEDRGPRSFVRLNGREVWFAAYPGGNGGRPDALARLDPATERIQYFDDIGPIGGIDATMTKDSIWMLDHDGKVTRIDLR
jgi:hypothetical protein